MVGKIVPPTIFAAGKAALGQGLDMSLPESRTSPLGGVSSGVHSVTSLVVQVGRSMTPNDVREKMGFN